MSELWAVCEIFRIKIKPFKRLKMETLKDENGIITTTTTTKSLYRITCDIITHDIMTLTF